MTVGEAGEAAMAQKQQLVAPVVATKAMVAAEQAEAMVEWRPVACCTRHSRHNLQNRRTSFASGRC